MAKIIERVPGAIANSSGLVDTLERRGRLWKDQIEPLKEFLGSLDARQVATLSLENLLTLPMCASSSEIEAATRQLYSHTSMANRVSFEVAFEGAFKERAANGAVKAQDIVSQMSRQGKLYPDQAEPLYRFLASSSNEQMTILQISGFLSLPPVLATPLGQFEREQAKSLFAHTTMANRVTFDEVFSK